MNKSGSSIFTLSILRIALRFLAMEQNALDHNELLVVVPLLCYGKLNLCCCRERFQFLSLKDSKQGFCSMSVYNNRH